MKLNPGQVVALVGIVGAGGFLLAMWLHGPQPRRYATGFIPPTEEDLARERAHAQALVDSGYVPPQIPDTSNLPQPVLMGLSAAGFRGHA